MGRGGWSLELGKRMLWYWKDDYRTLSQPQKGMVINNGWTLWGRLIDSCMEPATWKNAIQLLGFLTLFESQKRELNSEIKKNKKKIGASELFLLSRLKK